MWCSRLFFVLPQPKHPEVFATMINLRAAQKLQKSKYQKKAQKHIVEFDSQEQPKSQSASHFSIPHKQILHLQQQKHHEHHDVFCVEKTVILLIYSSIT